MKNEFYVRRPKHELKAIDREQGRLTLSPVELESLISTLVALSLFHACVPNLEACLREQKLLAKLKSSLSMASNACTALMDKLSLVQLDAIAANTQGVTIKVSSDPVDEYTFTNIQTELLSYLCKVARTKVCQDCLKSGKEALTCYLRQSLDGAMHKATTADVKNYWGFCPYCSEKLVPYLQDKAKG